jgi:hypothetical protein
MGKDATFTRVNNPHSSFLMSCPGARFLLTWIAGGANFVKFSTKSMRVGRWIPYDDLVSTDLDVMLRITLRLKVLS